MRCNYVGIRKMLFKYHKRQLLEAFGWKMISSEDWGIRRRSLIEAGNRGEEKAKGNWRDLEWRVLIPFPALLCTSLNESCWKNSLKHPIFAFRHPQSSYQSRKLRECQSSETLNCSLNIAWGWSGTNHQKQNLSSLCDQCCCPSQQASSLSNIVFQSLKQFCSLRIVIGGVSPLFL